MDQGKPDRVDIIKTDRDKQDVRTLQISRVHAKAHIKTIEDHMTRIGPALMGSNKAQELMDLLRQDRADTIRTDRADIIKTDRDKQDVPIKEIEAQDLQISRVHAKVHIKTTGDHMTRIGPALMGNNKV
jgi:hypothetical protein